MFWPLFLPFWVVFTHLQKHQGLCWGLLIPESRFKDSPGTFDPVTCQDSLFVPFTPWLQSTCVNLTGILLFPTPTRHNHPRIYLRSLSPVQGSRNTLDLKAWVGLPATAALLCPLTCPSLSASLTSAGHTLTACPLPPPPPVQLFIHFLPPGSSLIQKPALPISSKRHGQRLQLNPRSLGNWTATHPHVLSPGSPSRKCTDTEQVNASAASHWCVFKFPPAIISSWTCLSRWILLPLEGEVLKTRERPALCNSLCTELCPEPQALRYFTNACWW